MSLFGGSGSATSTEVLSDLEAERSQTSGTPPSPSRPADLHPSSPSVQHVTDTNHAYVRGVNDEPVAYSDTDASSSEEEPLRPNRFTGPQSTWQGYTAADRQVAASLEQLQNADLAAHLYNAHALERRVWRPDTTQLRSWQSKEHWLKSGSELQYTDVSGEVQAELVPPKDWTAWPLPLAEFTASARQPGHEPAVEDCEEWAIGGASTHDAGQNIRDELLATFMRQAKERWNDRENDTRTMNHRNRRRHSRSRSRSKSARSARSKRSASRTNASTQGDNDPETDPVEAQEDDEAKFGHIIGKKRGRVPQHDTFLRPTFLADDSVALRILGPTINSILNDVDGLALAVITNRQNHFGRGAYSNTSSQNEFTSGAETDGPALKTFSRAQTRKAARKERSTHPHSRATSRATSARSGHNPGYTRERETSVSTIQVQPSDSESTDTSAPGIDLEPDATDHDSTSRKRSRSDTSADEDNTAADRDWSRRTGLMDWSEILGLAGVSGWDERVIARTARRCATLFGESMSFIPLDESLAAKPYTEIVHYPLATISHDLLVEQPHPVKRPYFQKGTLRCPHVGCYGHEKDFKAAYRVVEHCKRVHNYDPRTNDSDNEERVVGGVHIDGFSLPVAAQQGWLGRGRSKAGVTKEKTTAKKQKNNKKRKQELEQMGMKDASDESSF
jgi:hypothetical protein